MPQWRCAPCNVTLTDDDSDTVVQHCLRRHIGLLSAEEIREARTALGLTQTDLAAILGCAAESISRWETGVMLQSRTSDRMLRLVFHVPVVRQILGGLTPESVVGRKTMIGAHDPPTVRIPIDGSEASQERAGLDAAASIAGDAVPAADRKRSPGKR